MIKKGQILISKKRKKITGVWKEDRRDERNSFTRKAIAVKEREN